jgi:hypothetical protein
MRLLVLAIGILVVSGVGAGEDRILPAGISQSEFAAAVQAAKPYQRYDEQNHAFYTKEVLEVFTKTCAKQEWHDAGLAFLREWGLIFSQHPDRKTSKDLVPEARRLLQIDADDAYLFYLATRTIVEAAPQDERPETLAKWSRWQPRLVGGPYNQLRRATALYNGARMLRGTEHWRPDIFAITWPMLHQAAILKQYQGCVTNWFSFFDYQWDHEPMDAHVDDRLAQLLKTIQQQDGESWEYHLLQGKYHLRMAWRARGGGWASTVTDEGWKGFRAHLAEARIQLEQAAAVKVDDPIAGALMLLVNLGNRKSPDEPGDWFLKAIQRDPNHRDAYDNLLLILRPRWGGSHQAIAEFGAMCGDTKRYDTIIPFYYWWSLVTILDDRCHDRPQPELVRKLLFEPETHRRLWELSQQTLLCPSMRGSEEERVSAAIQACLLYLKQDYDAAKRLMTRYDCQMPGFYRNYLGISWDEVERDVMTKASL